MLKSDPYIWENFIMLLFVIYEFQENQLKA